MTETENVEPKRRGRPVDQEARNFNIAIYRLVRGECDDLGGVLSQLSTITGLTEQSIKNRVHDVHFKYPPEELEPSQGELTGDDWTYLSQMYRNSNDPDVKEWLASLRSDPRRKPDDNFPSVRRPRSFSKN